MATMTAGSRLLDLIKDSKRKILMLAQISTRTPIDPENPKHKLYFPALEQVLSALEANPPMTPELKQESQINKILEVICEDARYHFPRAYAERARKLYNYFEADNWGGLPDIKDEEVDAQETAVDIGLSDSDGAAAPVAEWPHKRRKSTYQSKESKNAPADYKVIQPPADHPIWGTKGIMHGIALRLRPGRSLTKCLNPAFEQDKKNHKVHGHNGIEVGQWYPNRLAAIFAGAHGASQAGISGSNDTGAYSVVVSGQYEDLDTDEGETVYYSGSGSHDNGDPYQPGKSTTGTGILHASMQQGKVLRLLRTSSANIQYAPVEGLRYDGLYRVVALDMPRNAKGGRYERFKLVRETGQRSLMECKNRPTAQELRDYNRINAGYSGYGMDKRA